MFVFVFEFAFMRKCGWEILAYLVLTYCPNADRAAIYSQEAPFRRIHPFSIVAQKIYAQSKNQVHAHQQLVSQPSFQWLFFIKSLDAKYDI